MSDEAEARTVSPAATTLGDFQMYIDGAWVDAADGAMLDVVDPATEQVVARVANGGLADAEAAVLAARRAFDEGPWPRLSAHERADVPARRRRAAARALSTSCRCGRRLEMGKLQADGSGDILRVADLLEYAGELAERYLADQPITEPHALVREPVGVVVGLCPWNFPLVLAAFKFASALAAGNTVIIKPASISPLTALGMARIFHEVGLPAGVFQVSSARAAAWATSWPARRWWTWSRSRAASKWAARSWPRPRRPSRRSASSSAARRPTACTPTPTWTPPWTACCSASSATAARCAAPARGSWWSAPSPTVSWPRWCAARRTCAWAPALTRTRRWGRSRRPSSAPPWSATWPWACRRAPRWPAAATACEGPGFFFEPTVFTGVDSAMRIAQEEIFGPVLVVIPFDTEDEAIRIANDTVFGLTAGVWTADTDKARRYVRAVRAGTVFVNNTWACAPLPLPWGGFKQSGVGREIGDVGIEEFTELKAVIFAGA